MLVGESIVTPSSQRIPFNQTHYVAALTVTLYSACSNKSDMVRCFLIDQKMGPLENMKTKLEVAFLSVASPAQS